MVQTLFIPQNIHKNLLRKNFSFMTKKRSLAGVLSMLSLSACGGGSSSDQGPVRTAPTAPTPDFTESPEGVFTARDDNDRSLNMAQSSDDLTVIGQGGNDTIRTGSGMDLITGGIGNDQIFAGAGGDIIWSGLGNDTVDAGDGDDVIIFLGTSDADQYTQNALDNSAGQGLDLSDIITLEDVNNRQDSDASSGESVDGGQGFDTIVIYGDVDLSDVNISNIEDIYINSSVILTAEQFNQLQSVTGDDQSVVSIAASDTPITLDLSGKENLEVQELNVPSGTVIEVSSNDDVMSVGTIMTEGEVSITVEGGDGVSLSALSTVVDSGSVSDIMVADGSALVIDQPLSEPIHIEGDGQIMLSAELLSDPETLAQITVDDDVTLTDENGETLDAEETGVNYMPDIDEGEGVLPVLSADNVTVREAAEFAEVIFTLNAAYYEDVSFDYTLADGTIQTVTIPANETRITIPLTWEDDGVVDGAEVITLTLSNPQNVTLGTTDVTVTIEDDDTFPVLSIDNITADESLGSATFTASLDKVYPEDVSFDYTGPEGETHTVTILAGETEVTFDVTWSDDTLVETGETLSFTLSNPQNVTLATTDVTVTIEDDDTFPVLSIDNITADEALGRATFTASLDKAYPEDVSFDYTGPEGETHTVTILAGETEVAFDVIWSDDTTFEEDEIQTFILSNADNVVLGHTDFTLTIVDDEAPLPEALEPSSSLTILAGEVHAYNLNDLFKENEETLSFTVSGPDADLFEVTDTGILRMVTPATDGQSYSVSVTANNNSGSSSAVSLDFNVDPIVSFFSPEDAATHLPEHLLSNFHIYGSKWGGELGSNNGDPTVITWSIATENSQFSEWYHGFNILDRIGTDPTQQEIDAIQASLDMWSAVANVRFVYVDEVANPEIEGNLRFVFMDQFDTGVAWLPNGSADTGDIHINNNLRDQLIAGEVTFGNHILSHEIGHAVFNLVDTVPNAGINGEYLPWEINNHEWTIMSYLQLNNGTFVNAPMLYDVAAAQALFGANPNTGAGDTAYHFTDGDYQTIWDVDGIDEIDFSMAESAVRIDLREAHLSRIGDDGLVAIAYGVTIENAVGSDFDDSIYLNDSVNHIQAGLGDDLIKNASIGDWIDGGEGFDTVTVHSLSSDYTLELQEDQTYLLSSSDGDITLANIEIISFLDKKINLSDVDQVDAVSPQNTSVYLSINSDEFDNTLWGFTEDQAFAYIGTDNVLAGGEQLSPEAEIDGSVIINGVGGVYLDGAYDGSDISTAINYGSNSQIGAHQLHLSGISDNEYLIDLNTAEEQIAIWDYNGDDRLIIDGMDNFDITDSYQADGNFVISFRNAEDKSVTITIHNVRTYGLIEEVVFRRETGDEIYQLLPTESVLEIDFYREDPNGEFLFSNNYLFSGSNTGEGLYLAVDPFSEESYQNLGHIDEFIILGAGDDLIFGSSGSDQIQAYSGDDIIYGGDGGDRILAGLGSDTVYGGDGNDSINADFQSADIEGISGGDDIIYAGNGDDNIRHGQGNDLVYAGAGDDYIGGTFGGGDDILYGEDGDDYIDGGSGNDTLYGGSGDDEIYGDSISVRPEIAERDGQPGIDTIYAGSGDDTVRGGAAGDIIYGGDGDDYIEGDGPETEEYGLSGNDEIHAGAGNDEVRGGGGDDLIYGGDGDDYLIGDGPETEEYGLSGHDEIYGGAGNDTIAGNSGDDIISGGTGNDTLNGNEGADTFVFETGWGEDTIMDFTTGEDMLDFSGTGLSFEDLTIETVNGYIVISDENGNSITLAALSSTEVHETDFIF